MEKYKLEKYKLDAVTIEMLDFRSTAKWPQMGNRLTKWGKKF